MADFSKLNINDNTYDVKDSAARASITALQSEMPDKEDVSNKVTSMSASSTDTEYPSAKAVYDAILANSGLFVEITYGTTTSEEIDAILADNKFPYMYYGSRLYLYASSSTYYHMFTAFTEVGTVIWYGINVLRSSSAYSQVIISQSNAINSSSTNSQIPSAKAVYDFVTLYVSARMQYGHNISISGTGIYLTCRVTAASDQSFTSSTFKDFMGVSIGANNRIPAGGEIQNTSSQNVNVLQLSFNPYAYSGIGAYSAYGINSTTNAWEVVEFTPAQITSLTDTIGG